MRPLCMVLMLAVVAGTAAAQDDLTLDPPSLVEVTVDLQSGDADRQWFALWNFRASYSESAEAVTLVPVIAKLLDSPNADVRAEAALALASMRERAATAESKLGHVMENDPNSTVREYAELARDAVQGLDVALPGDPDFGLEDVPGEGQTPTAGGQWPQARADITDFLQPLRAHEAKLEAVGDRIEALAPQRPVDETQARKWTQDLKSAGQDLIAESEAFRTTLHQFIISPKRRGLNEEFDLIQSCFETTDAAAMDICDRTAFDVQGYHLDQALHQQSAAMRQKVIAMLAEEIDYRLEAEGLLVLLATDGIAAVRNEAVQRLRTGVEERVDEITERELGIAFHDQRSFATAVQHKLRSLVRMKVHELLFNITSNEIVVELLGAPIIRWLETDLWPKLKEAFRNKGNLEFRTQRSIGTFEQAEQRLWALPPDAALDTVQAALSSASGTMQAANYLVGDIQRANRTDLYQKLDAAADDLKWVMETTEHRFLLDKAEKIEELEAAEELYRALVAMIEAMVQEIEAPTQVARGWGQQVQGGGEAGFMGEMQPVEDADLAGRISGTLGARGDDEPTDQIAGTYDGQNENRGMPDEITVVISGSADGGLSWKMTRKVRGSDPTVRSGVMSDTGETWQGYRVFGGYFEIPRNDPGWAETKVAEVEGAWRAVLLDIWNNGKPNSHYGAWRIYLTKQE